MFIRETSGGGKHHEEQGKHQTGQVKEKSVLQIKESIDKTTISRMFHKSSLYGRAEITKDLLNESCEKPCLQFATNHEDNT